MTIVQASDKELELRLAHFSVKEYLLGENQFSITTASISITMTCLIYLTDIDGSHDEIKRNFPMSTYAAETWTSYALAAQANTDVVRATVSFLEDEATFQRWTRLYQADVFWSHDPGPPRASRLYYSCLDGLINTARDLIANGADVNSQGGSHGTALQAASFSGHREIVQLLLDEGADVNAQGGIHGTALQAASLEDHQEIVQLLLDK